MTLRLIVKLSNEDSAATGTLTSVDQGGIELPSTTITQTGTNLTLVVASVQGRFQGALKDGRLEGTWTQGPTALPLVLEHSVAK